MALFNKKKSQTPASLPASAAPSAGNGSSDDFSDFSPEALGAPDAGSTPIDKKARKAAAARDKKATSGRAIKPGVAIGLNIGSDSIKAIELQAKGNEMVITGMGMVPTPSESISNGVVMSANALVGGIRDVLSQAGIKSKRVVTSVSGTGALVVRIIEVPKMSDAELADNMKMDADRYIPFPPSEVIMDSTALRELPSDPDSPNMEVLLAAAQREVIDLHVQVLQDAKLDVRSIDVEPLAAARALTHPLITGVNGNAFNPETEVDYNDVAAVLNVGASGTEISILRGDLLVFTRTVPTAGNTLTQALVDMLGLAWSDAEQLKREMGDALPPSSDDSLAGSTPVAASDAADSDWANAAADNADATESWDDFHAEPDAVADIPSDSNSAMPAAPAAPTSNDPFADDFYEQGPDNIRRTEPGEQHQQKQEDDALFDFGDDLPSVSSEANAEKSGGLSTPDADDALLPATQSTTPSASAPTENAFPDAPSTPAAAAPTAANAHDASNPFFDFGHADEPEDRLPTLKDGSPVNFADFLLGEEDDLGDLPTLREDSPEPGAVPSAFEFPTEVFEPPAKTAAPTNDDFADLSLPTFSGQTTATEVFGGLDKEEENLLPSESKPAATTPADNAFSFSFEDSLIAAPEPAASAENPIEVDPFAEFMASAEPTPENMPTVAPAIAASTAAAAPAKKIALDKTPAASTPAAADDDFDLDSLFVDTPNAAGSATVAGDSLDFDGLNLSDDVFGMDDTAFGAGLGGAPVGEIDAQTLYSVLQPVLDNLINEVRRSLEYHTTRYPDAAIRRVVLTGGGAKLTNLDAFFTQQLGIPTTIGNPAARLPVRAPNLPPGYADQNGSLFTVALGLAMRELTR